MEYKGRDKLDHLIGLALMQYGDPDVKYFDSIDTSNTELDEQFYKKRDRIIRRYRRQPIMQKIRFVAARVAIFVLAVLSAATITIAAIPDLRRAVFDVIVEWYDDYLDIRYVPQGDGGADTEQTDGTNDADDTNETEQSTDTTGGVSTQALVKEPPTTIEEIRKPTYIPDGVFEDVVMENSAQTCIDYYLGEELVYSFEQSTLKRMDLYFNNENTIVQDIKLGGKDTKLVVNLATEIKSIVWTDGEYVYSISFISYEEDSLDKIIESVK